MLVVASNPSVRLQLPLSTGADFWVWVAWAGSWKVYVDRGDLVVVGPHRGKAAMLVYDKHSNILKTMHRISSVDYLKPGWQTATTWYRYFGWP